MARLTGLVQRLAGGFGRRLRPPRIRFVYHEDYVQPVPGIPVDPQRAERILAFLLDAASIRPAEVSWPTPASLEHIARVHTRAYLESLDRPDALERVFGFPVKIGRAHV